MFDRGALNTMFFSSKFLRIYILSLVYNPGVAPSQVFIFLI
ncbi:VOC family protein, partial [Listeria monocytogenes]|nr:VOC family protein [Listeria monocytogenes]